AWPHSSRARNRESTDAGRGWQLTRRRTQWLNDVRAGLDPPHALYLGGTTMKRLIVSAALALVCSLFLAGGAGAHTYSFACAGAAGELQLRLNGTNAWTTTDGGAGTTIKPVAGDTVEIDGTTNSQFCNGDIFVNTTGVTF